MTVRNVCCFIVKPHVRETPFKVFLGRNAGIDLRIVCLQKNHLRSLCFRQAGNKGRDHFAKPGGSKRRRDLDRHYSGDYQSSGVRSPSISRADGNHSEPGRGSCTFGKATRRDTVIGGGEGDERAVGAQVKKRRQQQRRQSGGVCLAGPSNPRPSRRPRS